MSKAEILDLLPTLRPDERQEILDRLCDLQEADLTAVHQEWVNEALDSGTARPAEAADWEGALTRGLARASKRSGTSSIGLNSGLMQKRGFLTWRKKHLQRPRLAGTRLEERRVGKECRSRWSPYQ